MEFAYKKIVKNSSFKKAVNYRLTGQTIMLKCTASK